MGLSYFWAENLKNSIFKYGHIFSKSTFRGFLSSGGSNYSLLTPADFQDKSFCASVLSTSKYSYF